jgi:predicted GTPase
MKKIRERVIDTLNDVVRVKRLLGLTLDIDELKSKFLEVSRETINVSVIGSSNSGKSTLINTLLKRKVLPASVLPSSTNSTVLSIALSEKEFVVVEDKRFELENLNTALEHLDAKAAKIEYHLDVPWLQAREIQLQEKQLSTSFPPTEDQYDLEFYCQTDIALVVLDSLMPLTKTDKELLQYCKEFSIPTIVLLSKYDKVNQEEQESLKKSIKQKISQISNSFLFIENEAHNGLSSIGDKLLQELDRLISNRNFPKKRLELLNLLSIREYESLKLLIKAKQNEADERVNLINEKYDQKQVNIEDRSFEWQQIEGSLTEIRQKIEQKMRNHLKDHRNQVLLRLQHELERSKDLKEWWEKDLQYSLKRELHHLASVLNNDINEQISKGLNWLQDEIDHHFDYQISSYPRFKVMVEEANYPNDDIKLTDNRRLRNITRVGTAVSGVLAATILASTGVIGTIFVLTTAGGLATDYWIQHRGKNEKGKIKTELSKILERAELVYVNKTSQNLKEVFDKIIDNLKQYQKEWKNAQMEELLTQKKQELQGVLANTQWNDLLHHIDNQILTFSETL